MTDLRRYQDADVRAVIDRALERQSSDGVSHSDLLEIGAEVGLSRDAIESAAHDVLEAHSDAVAASRVTARRRRWLLSHALLFAVLNGLLFLVNLLTTPGEWWVLFSVFTWGLVLLLHAGVALGLQIPASALLRERQRLDAPRGARSRPHRRLDPGPTAAPDAEQDTESERDLVEGAERRSGKA